MISLFRKVFGTRNDRVIKSLRKQVAIINGLEPTMQQLSDSALRDKTKELKERFKQGATLDDLLPEAFAVVREASVRTLGLRHFDVQLIGGIVLHQGKVAEMRTGEGKTLVATLAIYLNALSGKSVHLVTVNDYLAKRDAEWMRPIYNFLGLSVGVIYSSQPNHEKKKAYRCDVVYGTNNEFGFDYLRDNMVFNFDSKVQNGLCFAIVDEVDSILIDEARTPLIISGSGDNSSDLYVKVDQIIPKLQKQARVETLEHPLLPEEVGDYTVDEKEKQAYFTERGHRMIEKYCVQMGLLQAQESLYDTKNIKLMHYLNAALRAHTLFHRDIDYIVKNGEIIIVDEHTGRTMEGRRWSDGLHQAVEAKERVEIKQENQTLASITFQNFFRLYDKLAGMTGTADTEAYEFQQIYGLEVTVIPTNRLVIRQDFADQVFLTKAGKFKAILNDIKERSTRGQPVLVGTASIETSEYLSGLLNKNGIKHQVLNAKQHEKEANIIAQAGRPGVVTIATNMAGRGTDILLGGNLNTAISNLDQEAADYPQLKKQLEQEWQKMHDQVVAAGGLHVIGSERHESRRIDNQLRGRSGRQGDPGSSRFYLSLEDNLLRIFASGKLAGLMKKLGMKEDEVVEHRFVTKAIENAQRKVEGFNFDIRKHLLEFDDVANEQRKIIYSQRDNLMQSKGITEMVDEMRADVIEETLAKFIPDNSIEENWNLSGLEQEIQYQFGVELPVREWQKQYPTETALKEEIKTDLQRVYRDKWVSERVSPEILVNLERDITLQTLDDFWKEHLVRIDALRDGIHLRGYAQQDPKREYKKEAFNLFAQMLEQMKREIVRILYIVKLRNETKEDLFKAEQPRLAKEQRERLDYNHNHLPIENSENRTQLTLKVGRNALCPCGSNKKYKHCCGKL